MKYKVVCKKLTPEELAVELGVSPTGNVSVITSQDENGDTVMEIDLPGVTLDVLQQGALAELAKPSLGMPMRGPQSKETVEEILE